MQDYKTIYPVGDVLDFVTESLSRAQLAAQLEVSISSLDKWRNLGTIPAKHACALADITGLGPWQICPDVFDPQYAVTRRERALITAIRRAQERLGDDEDVLGGFLHETQML